MFLSFTALPVLCLVFSHPSCPPLVYTTLPSATVTLHVIVDSITSLVPHCIVYSTKIPYILKSYDNHQISSKGLFCCWLSSTVGTHIPPRSLAPSSSTSATSPSSQPSTSEHRHTLLRQNSLCTHAVCLHSIFVNLLKNLNWFTLASSHHDPRLLPDFISQLWGNRLNRGWFTHVQSCMLYNRTG